jgi:hypothetical protein
MALSRLRLPSVPSSSWCQVGAEAALVIRQRRSRRVGGGEDVAENDDVVAAAHHSLDAAREPCCAAVQARQAAVQYPADPVELVIALAREASGERHLVRVQDVEPEEQGAA